MQSRKLIRGGAIAVGVAALLGFGLGLAAGKTEDPAAAPTARRLPSDLCKRLGDVSALFPVKVELQQTGVGEVRCNADVDENSQPSYTAAELSASARTYAAKPGSTAEDVARDDFDDEPWQAVKGRPYPTKMDSEPRGEDSWHISVLITRGDLVVRVEYTAQPVARAAAENAAISVAEKMVWEAR